MEGYKPLHVGGMIGFVRYSGAMTSRQICTDLVLEQHEPGHIVLTWPGYESIRFTTREFVNDLLKSRDDAIMRIMRVLFLREPLLLFVST